MTTTTTADQLNTHYPLSDAQITQFREQGFIKLKNVFSQEVLDHYGKTITDCVKARNDLADVPMDQRDTYQKAFLQVMNLWREDETVREFVFGKRLARLAAELMEVSGVRLYHDQALYKEPSGGFTPWHADQQYWPLATDRTITAWVPLHAVPHAMGPLSFAAGSQQMTFGRDLEISDASEAKLTDALERSDYAYVEEPFELGEISFHHGWTYHKAGPNTTADPRRIITVIYMDEQMKLETPTNSNQQRDWDTWCPGAEVGQTIDTPLNPVLYSHEDS
jgi:ectoine hydroxylase-related dioxygenase (phytanoyl-CoA dioxygenase family)